MSTTIITVRSTDTLRVHTCDGQVDVPASQLVDYIERGARSDPSLAASDLDRVDDCPGYAQGGVPEHRISMEQYKHRDTWEHGQGGVS